MSSRRSIGCIRPPQGPVLVWPSPQTTSRLCSPEATDAERTQAVPVQPDASHPRRAQFRDLPLWLSRLHDRGNSPSVADGGRAGTHSDHERDGNHDERARAWLPSSSPSMPAARRCPVLEVGAAYGNASYPALEAGGTVIACDLAEEELTRLRRAGSSRHAEAPHHDPGTLSRAASLHNGQLERGSGRASPAFLRWTDRASRPSTLPFAGSSPAREGSTSSS